MVTELYTLKYFVNFYINKGIFEKKRGKMPTFHVFWDIFLDFYDFFLLIYLTILTSIDSSPYSFLTFVLASLPYDFYPVQEK